MVSSASTKRLAKEEILKEEAKEEKMEQLITPMDILTKNVMGF